MSYYDRPLFYELVRARIKRLTDLLRVVFCVGAAFRTPEERTAAHERYFTVRGSLSLLSSVQVRHLHTCRFSSARSVRTLQNSLDLTTGPEGLLCVRKEGRLLRSFDLPKASP